MDKQIRFQKQKLNGDDNKRTENGAKITKGILSAIGAVVILFVNKDNLKALGKGMRKS